MADVKQVIAVRKDLNMRKGKVAAQVAHAAMKVFFDRMKIVDVSGHESLYTLYIPHISEDEKKWIQGSFTKVVVSVNSEEEIYDLAKRATDLAIPHAVIVDSGFTEFHGNKTTTCIAIGPDKSEKIDELTKDLPLI